MPGAICQATAIADEGNTCPWAVLQLIRCNCESTNVESTSKCSRRCSCKRHNLVCIELCNCAGYDKCQNTEPILNGLDIENDNDWVSVSEYNAWTCTCARRMCSNQTLWVVGSLSTTCSGFSCLLSTITIHILWTPKLSNCSKNCGACIKESCEASLKVSLFRVCAQIYRITLRLCSPVPMITAEFLSSFGTLRRAGSRTSVPHEYTWTSYWYQDKDT